MGDDHAVAEQLAEQGRYRLLRRLGEGGMGTVFEVEHVLVGKRFALKTLRPDLARDAATVGRFHREARAAAAAGDRHIVDVTDMGTLADGTPYLVMELIEGRSLARELELGALPVARAVHVALQCCRALGAAHRRGIVHRDVKPENILLIQEDDDPDFVKLVDFGVSKMIETGGEPLGPRTSTGTTLGTPFYMAPEQLEGRTDVDARADVYALGVVLFEALAGRRPFEADTFALLAVRVLTEVTPSLETFAPHVPPALAAVVARTLERDRERRFASMEELARALEPFVAPGDAAGAAPSPRGAGRAAATPQPARLTTPPPSVLPLHGQGRGALAVLAIAAGLVVLGLAGWLGLREPTTQGARTVPSAAPPGRERLAVADPAPVPEPEPERPAQPRLPETASAGGDEERPAAAIDAGRNANAPRRGARGPERPARPTPPAVPAPGGRAASSTRTVAVRNTRPTPVTVTLTCGASPPRSVVVAAGGRGSLSVPLDARCRVRCAAAGATVFCPVGLPPGAGSFEVR